MKIILFLVLESPKVYPTQQGVQQQNQFRIQNTVPQQKPADFMEDQSQVLSNQNQNLQNQSKQQFLMQQQQQFQKQQILLHQNSAQNQNMNANNMGQQVQVQHSQNQQMNMNPSIQQQAGNNQQVSDVLFSGKKLENEILIHIQFLYYSK